MSLFTDDQVRYLILNFLYQQEREKPDTFTDRDRDTMQRLLKLPENQMDFNMKYLDQKGLVRLELAGGAPWWCANITAFGIDVLEHKETFKHQFSFTNAIIHVQGNNYGNIAQATNNSIINIGQQVSDAFNKAYALIDGKTDVTVEQKTEIEKQTKILEEELRKNEPDAGTIQHSWKWLRENANWIVPTLSQVVIEGIKIACGIP